MIEEDKKTFKLTFKDQRRIINKEITLLDLVVEKQEEIERLNKELEYSDFCNKQLRDTIANLEYKTKRLEEDLKELKGKKKIGEVVSLEELESYLPQNDYEVMEQDLLFKD